MRSRLFDLAARLVLGLTLAAGATACKGSSDATSAAGGSGTAVAGSNAAKPAAAKAVAVPADVCSLLPAAAVSKILGETVEGRAVPGGGCQFPGGTAASLYPTVSIALDSPGAGGIDGAKAGAQATLGSTATPFTTGDAGGYLITGTAMGSTSTQGAVATRGLIVTVSVAGGAKATNEPIVGELLKLAVAGL